MAVRKCLIALLKTAHFFVGLQKFVALRTTTYVSQKFLCPPRIASVLRRAIQISFEFIHSARFT